MKRSSDIPCGSSPAKKPVEPETKLEQGHIYLTPIGGITVPRAESAGAYSLTQIIAFIRPINSLHLNYILDFEFLHSCYPEELKDTPMTLCVGVHDAKALEKITSSHKNVQVVAAPLPIPYGVHHSKMSIFESADGKVHVLVYTANFTSEDWEFKTQQFYYAYGYKKETEKETPHSFFHEDLYVYLGMYRGKLATWRSLMLRVDFTEVKDRLVYSSPGRFQYNALDRIGHTSLRKRLSEQFPAKDPEPPLESITYIVQCSSIGSLGPHPDAWFRKEFLESLEASNPSPKQCPPNLRLIFPCVDDVRKSCRGYLSGVSIPYKMKIHSRQKWLETCKMLFKWRSHAKRRTLAMPHCKSYVKFHRKLPQWQLITSANLSKAAWGEYTKDRKWLFIRSYEMGVLITDPARFNIPFDYPLVPYSQQDSPFTIDTKHWEKDIFDHMFNPVEADD